ncbi:MAG: type II toxin-antitoxin system PemK/MazF family toxin, partial [Cyanobacteria bacterium P01_D01_bin.36]
AVNYPHNLVIEYWQRAGLLKPSVVKPIVATLQTNLLLRQLGTLVVSDREALKALLTEIVG